MLFVLLLVLCLVELNKKQPFEMCFKKKNCNFIPCHSLIFLHKQTVRQTDQ